MLISEPALLWEGESWQHFGYLAVTMELEGFWIGAAPVL
jgi:hypothetical protein